MLKSRAAVLLMLLALLSLPACSSGTPEGDGDDTTTATDGHEDHGHDHGDELTWVREELESQGFLVSLGHHGPHADAGHAIELAATVSKDGTAVEDAQVFVTVVADDGNVGEEKAMTFEPASDDEPAHYAQAKVDVPEKAERMTVRYRVVLPGVDDEFSQDVVLTVESHH